MLNEAMKCNMLAHEEEVWRFPSRYIELVMSQDEHGLGLNREMREAFRVHFRDRFAHCPDFLVQEFHSYLANLPCLQAAEVASCESVVTKCIVFDALKQVSLNIRQYSMVYPTMCTWGCHTCLCLFWRIYSTTCLPREPSLVALPRAWSHC